MDLWKKKVGVKKEEKQLPIIDISLQQVKDAVREFELQLDKGIKRTVLLNKDQSIDFELLHSYLEGLPNQSFYMSRETYEIFEQEEREIPYYLDKVQKAVDQYIDEFKEHPIVPSDLHRKVNLELLLNRRHLDVKPPMDFYLTDEENLITHKKPKNN